MGSFTGTVPSHAAGATSKASKLQTLDDVATALTAAWTVWVPTLTNLTAGSGTLSARYRQLNKTVDFRFEFTLGAGSAVGTQPGFTLPVAPHSSYSTGPAFASASLVDVTGFVYPAGALYDGASVVGFRVIGSAGTYAAHDGNVTAIAPFTWTTPDKLVAWGTYEAA